MKKIIIKDSRNADSRTADKELTEETLKESTLTHINEVGACIDLMADKLHEIGKNHDWTKIEYFDEFVKYGSAINGSGSLDKIYNQTVKKVTEDYENLGFNILKLKYKEDETVTIVGIKYIFKFIFY